jgi:hypothetical protein
VKPIAVQGCAIKPLVAPLSLASYAFGGPSAKVKAGGNFAYRGPTQVTAVVMMAGYSIAGTPNVFTIRPASQKVRADGQPVLLEGDTSDPLTMTFNGGPQGSSATASVTLEIQSAGQTAAAAN